jgi:hypothetical protein
MKVKPPTVFWGNKRVSHAAILEVQRAETLLRMKGAERVLLVQDTSSFNFSHHLATTGLGPLQNVHGRGFLAHTTLAVSRVGVPAEAHIYEFLDAMVEHGLDFVVRAADAWGFTQEGQALFASIAQQKVQQHFTLSLKRRPDRAARTAELELRFSQLPLKRLQRATVERELLTMFVVDGVQPHPPADEAVVHWVLLTSLPVQTVEQARQTPDVACTVALLPTEWQALYAFIHRTHRLPNQPPSLRQAVRWIGQLGGFLGRKEDGEPGVKVLWRGWTRLQDILQTWSIFHPPQDVGNV